MLPVKMKNKMLVGKKTITSTVYGLQRKMIVELLYIKKVNVPINVSNTAKASIFKFLKCRLLLYHLSNRKKSHARNLLSTHLLPI